MKSTGPAQFDYWTTAREPWPSLLFILPFLVVYEVGAFSQSHLPASRNGADLWIRQFGMESGVFVEWIFPLMAPLFLLIWQLVGRRPWKWNLETLSGMFAESLMFAMLLVTVGQIVAFAVPMQILLDVSPVNFSRVVSFLGAGIYEEMLFRLTLLPVTFGLLRVLLVPSRIAILGSILFSSWLFATAHYVGSTSLLAPDELFRAMQTVCQSAELWFSYSFRFIAGLLFSALFWYRGFGIAVGCHILYDVIVGVLLSGIG